MRDPSLVRFRRVVAAACDELDGRRQEVNDLNVFPVPDGDTGDNMAMTLRAVLDEIDAIGDEPLDQIGRDKIVAAVARAALLGARGNSGVLLSQETANGLSIARATYGGKPIAFSDIGVARNEDFGVSNPRGSAGSGDQRGQEVVSGPGNAIVAARQGCESLRFAERSIPRWL